MRALSLAFCFTLLPLAALPADYSDPDWPCIQRKVETLSAGLMWPHPVTEMDLPAPAQDLAAELSLRRVGLDQAEEKVRTFLAAASQADANMLGNIFSAVVDRLSADRRRLIDGIARYSRKQTALAAEIDRSRTEMDAQLAAATPDYDKIDALEEKIDWEERIYRERAQSLTYVCETPVLLEKRAYAIAQILLRQLPQ